MLVKAGSPKAAPIDRNKDRTPPHIDLYRRYSLIGHGSQ
uniref:Uncharacterized protein n=1 Tax=Arundo donax TaxID=35708 RepID=A0A0A9BKC5_ARUDO